MSYLDKLQSVADADVIQLLSKDKEYGGSWKQRGGVGAFMMTARKWDRVETQLMAHGYDIFQAIEADPVGFLDDVGDLRRYLMLIEAEMIDRGIVGG